MKHVKRNMMKTLKQPIALAVLLSALVRIYLINGGMKIQILMLIEVIMKVQVTITPLIPMRLHLMRMDIIVQLNGERE